MNIFESPELRFVKSTPAQFALVLAIAALLWASGAPMFLDHAKAADLANVSDTLTQSGPGLFSGHTISYISATSTLQNQTIVVTLDPDGNGFIEQGDAATTSHFEIFDNSTPIPIVSSCGSGATLTSSGSHGTLTFTLCSGTNIPGGDTITIQMATSSQDFVNPANGSYRVTIGGTQLNSGETRVAIVPNVVLTAAVNTTFTFTVTGVATGTYINGVGTDRSSTNTTLPFGTLTSGTTTTLGQQLNVTTNARDGFVVTVQENQPPTSGNGAIINLFKDGASTTTPVPWTSPLGQIGHYNTYGHFGVTSNDTDEGGNEWLATTTTPFAGDLYHPRPVFANPGPADGVTQNVGLADVLYRIEISPLQAAGDDYTNTLTYVATPTF